MVTTFHLADDGAMHEIARHSVMSEASAALPEGAYTTFRTYKRRRVLRCSQHFQRLEESLALTGRHLGTINNAMARRAIGRIIALTNYAESRFRLTYAPEGLFISIEPFAPYPHELYEAGVQCATVSLHRNNPHAKSTTFIASAAEAYKTLPEGTHEGLMIADDGAVLEGLSSNFFALAPSPQRGEGRGEGRNLILHTEEARVLMGVTRSLVLEVARDVVSVSTGAVTYDDLATVSECFITSVSREILPVVKIDQIVIGDGTPGPVTRELMRRFRELVEREAEELV